MKFAKFYGNVPWSMSGACWQLNSQKRQEMLQRVQNGNYMERVTPDSLSIIVLNFIKTNGDLSRNEINKRLIEYDDERFASYKDGYYSYYDYNTKQRKRRKTTNLNNGTFARLRWLGLIEYTKDRKIALGPNFNAFEAHRPELFREDENSIRSMLKA